MSRSSGHEPAASEEPSINWSGRLRATARSLATSPSLAASHRAYREGGDAPEHVEGFRSLDCRVLRNVTVEPWLPDLYAALLQRGVKARFHVGDFDVYERYVANPSELPGPEPGLILVYFDSETLAGDARHDPPSDLSARLLDRMRAIVSGLLQAGEAEAIVSNLGPDAHPTHRLHGDQDPLSWQHQRRAVNLGLADALADEPRAHILDVDRIVSEHGASRACDVRNRLTVRSPFATGFVPKLAEAFADIAAAALLPPRKCVVVDCDNTLWKGVLGEDGPDGVGIGRDYPGSAYREFQLFLRGLRDRGFLLALSSRNDESDVLSFLESSPEMVLRPPDFAARRINWRDKAASLREIAEELNIGLDSFIFIDDSPVECARVSEALPEVLVARFPENPLEIPAFASSLRGVERLRVGSEDRARAASLAANAKREAIRREAPDFAGFLRRLEIELTISVQDDRAVARVSQLTQRTNQFNLTAKRYGVGEIEALMRRGRVYSMAMKDRFSDYGVVAAAVALTGGAEDGGEDGSDAWVVDSFLMSCRAFGREIENVLLGALVDDAAAAGARSVVAVYRRTARNGMTRDFYPGNGFRVAERLSDGLKFEYVLEGERAGGLRGPYIVRREGVAG